MAHKISVGNAEILSFTDLKMEFPWQVFFPNIASAELEPYRELYPECWGELGFCTDAGCYAVRSGGKTVLVDTGLGPGPHAWLRGAKGNLVEDMRAKGLAPEDVGIVVHTHLHTDHVGWNLTGGAPTFPNARYYAPKADWDYFSTMLAANPQMAEQVIPLKELGRLEIYEGEVTLAPEVTTLPTPGHTPGHSSVLVSSNGARALITGDLAHHPAQVDHTEWSPAFDVDPAQSAATRKAMVEKLAAEGMIAAFCHFPGEGFGRIAESGGKRIFQAP
jgi:glyoxylase-like metal-dependent hydrolase (beta-lactamase superfamily II)